MALYKVDETTADLTLVAGGTLWADSPIGTILPYGGTSAPSGWFLCQGQALSRTTYSELFAVIGTSFGSGDGSTTFNIPDMRESVPKGAGLTGKSNNHMDADGLAVGEFLDDRVQTHTHSENGTVSGGAVLASGSGKEISGRNTGTNTGRSGATTEVKSVGVNYIIKAKMCAMPSDFMSKVDEAVEEVATRFPDYAHQITIPSASANSWTATQDCYVVFQWVSPSTFPTFTIDGVDVISKDNTTLTGGATIYQSYFTGYVKKGQVIETTAALTISTRFKAFPLV